MPIINHKDENPLNNDVNNLEWCTQKYNMDYSHVLEKAHNAQKKKVSQYDLNGNYIKTYPSIAEAKRMNQCDVYKCYKGLNHTAGGFIWKFKEVKQ